MKKLITKNRIIASTSSAITALTLFASGALADQNGGIQTGVTPITNNPGENLIADTISNAIVYILGFSAAIATVFLIFGGIKYVVSQGNSESIEGAKHTIMYSIIGLVIISLSYVIVKYAGNILPKILLGT